MKLYFGMPTTPRFYAGRLLAECDIKEPPVPDHRIAEYLGLPTKFYSQQEYDAFFLLGPGVPRLTPPAGQPTLFDTSLFVRPRPMLSRKDEHIDSLLIRRGSERTVWLNENKPARRRRSKRCHEFGHDYLPSHQSVGYNPDTCRSNVRAFDPWEREANQFAADLLMWPTWFQKDITYVPLGFTGLEVLVDRYDTSLETTAIQFVKLHPGRCLLLVGELAWDLEERAAVFLVRYSLRSDAFPYYVAPGTVLSADSPLGECALGGKPECGSVQGLRIGLPTTARYEIECRPWGPAGEVIALAWQPCPQQRNLFN